ncbi:MAG: class I SAM-dependent methyltransferase [Bryobacteraceae bacterium]
MNCDRIARLYRWLEYAAFGKALERRRLAFLPMLQDARRVLVLGDGDGRALEALLKSAPQATIDAVDSSAKMLALAKSRSGEGRVQYHHGDARTLAFPPSEYDAIVTHFFLDCLTATETSCLIRRVRVAAKPGALWVISEFRQDSRWTHAFVRGLYFFFAVTTGLQVRRIADYRNALGQCGFVSKSTQTTWGGLLVSELWREGTANAGAPIHIHEERAVPGAR